MRELFRVADENSPAIVFIDEIDAIGTKRYDANSGGEREIQRTMLELLNQLDGFDFMSEVKVCQSASSAHQDYVVPKGSFCSACNCSCFHDGTVY